MKEITFEDALQQLTEITKSLGSEDITLEKGISLYKKGVELSELCASKLEQAELQVKEVKSD